MMQQTYPTVELIRLVNYWIQTRNRSW